MVVGFAMVYRAPLGLKYFLIVEQCNFAHYCSSNFSCLFDVSFFTFCFLGIHKSAEIKATANLKANLPNREPHTITLTASMEWRCLPLL